jgi:hypothetical protein
MNSCMSSTSYELRLLSTVATPTMTPAVEPAASVETAAAVREAAAVKGVASVAAGEAALAKVMIEMAVMVVPEHINVRPPNTTIITWAVVIVVIRAVPPRPAVVVPIVPDTFTPGQRYECHHTQPHLPASSYLSPHRLLLCNTVLKMPRRLLGFGIFQTNLLLEPVSFRFKP